jgi:hypothetical protein
MFQDLYLSIKHQGEETAISNLSGRGGFLGGMER